MIEDIVAHIKAELAQAEKAGEPDDWKLPVTKADLRSLLMALNGLTDEVEHTRKAAHMLDPHLGRRT